MTVELASTENELGNENLSEKHVRDLLANFSLGQYEIKVVFICLDLV